MKTLDNPVNLIALTPGTSFNSASSEGVVEERIILYRMLLQTWGDLVRRSHRVFLGGLQSVSRFQDYERYYPARPIDLGIVKRFHESVGDSGSSMYEEFLELSAALNTNRNSTSRARRIRFIANFRRILARSCLDALEPDLVILDEFQRFRDLSDSNTESGELAQRLFEYEDSHTRVRTMLLSATPYKSDTLSHELDDDHCKDFLGTVGFLKGPEGSVEPLEESLRQFRAELPRVVAEGEVEFEAAHRLSGHRDRIEAELGRVMSRTERRSGEVLGDPMLAVEDLPVGLETDDVESYLSARDISSAVYAPGIMEYWKSTPYLPSFAEQYRVAERVRSAVESEPQGEVAELIQSGTGLQLPRASTSQRLEVTGGNGRMRAFLNDLEKSGLQELLWLPPVLAGHKLGPHFEQARTATKRLVFSSWAMVPRAISVLASYDAERRYIPEPERADQYVPRALGTTRTGYTLFAFLLPTAVLAEAGDPYRYPYSDTSELLQAIAERLRPQVEQLTKDAPTSGQAQNIWYAVAPLLLENGSVDYAGWLRDASRANATGDVDDAEHSVWGGLVANVQDGLADPSRLGRPPTISSICWRYSLWDRRQMLRYEHSLASLGYPLRDRVWKGKRLQRRGIPLVLPVSHFRRSLAQPILSLRALQYANLCAKGTRVYSRGRFVGSPGRVFPCAPGIKWRSAQRIRPGGFAVRSSEIGHWAVGRNRVGKQFYRSTATALSHASALCPPLRQ